jgi:hypothetical protein
VSEIFTTFDTFRDIQPSFSQALNSWTSFFDFGDDDVPTSAFMALQVDPTNTIADTTQDLIVREINRTTVNDCIKVASLVYAYNDAAGIDFDTIDNLEEVQNTLDTQYQNVKDSTLLTTPAVVIPTTGVTVSNTTAEQSSEGLEQLQELRDNVRQFFNARRISTPQVQTINTPQVPAAVLSFILYGSVDNAEQLLDLNGVTSTPDIGGQNTKVITEE